MSKVTVSLSASVVKALELFAAKNDIRYYLNGLLVELSGEDAFLVDTDGHRLAAFRATSDMNVEERKRAIVPRELLARIVAGRSAHPVLIAVEDDDTVSVTQGQITTSSKAIPGLFPNWRKVIPASTTGIAAQINPKYVADIGKATRLVTGAKGLPNIRYNGEGCALVDIGEPNFVAAIMPYRENKEKAYVPPVWAVEAAESLV